MQNAELGRGAKKSVEWRSVHQAHVPVPLSLRRLSQGRQPSGTCLQALQAQPGVPPHQALSSPPPAGAARVLLLPPCRLRGARASGRAGIGGCRW